MPSRASLLADQWTRDTHLACGEEVVRAALPPAVSVNTKSLYSLRVHHRTHSLSPSGMGLEPRTAPATPPCGDGAGPRPHADKPLAWMTLAPDFRAPAQSSQPKRPPQARPPHGRVTPTQN